MSLVFSVGGVLGQAVQVEMPCLASQVAQLLLSAPVVDKGRCLLWLRQDVERWARATGRA